MDYGFLIHLSRHWSWLHSQVKFLGRGRRFLGRIRTVHQLRAWPGLATQSQDLSGKGLLDQHELGEGRVEGMFVFSHPQSYASMCVICGWETHKPI